VDLWNKPGIYVEQKPTKTRRRSKVYKNGFIGKKPFELLFSPITKYTFEYKQERTYRYFKDFLFLHVDIPNKRFSFLF